MYIRSIIYIIAGVISYLSRVAIGQLPCQDQSYFNYPCSQLKHFCGIARAAEYQQACPVTCGVCGTGSGRPLANQLSAVELPDPVPQVQPAPRITPNQPRQIPFSVAPQPRRPPAARPNNRIAFSRSRLPDQRFQKLPQQQSKPGGFRPRPQHGRRVSSRRPFKYGVSGDRRAVRGEDAQRRIKNCCQGRRVTPHCMPLCRYDTTRNEIINHALTGKCNLDDAKAWVACAADGNDNVRCCKLKGVSGCDEYCRGGFSPSFTTTLTCLNAYLEPILRCHRDGLKPER